MTEEQFYKILKTNIKEICKTKKLLIGGIEKELNLSEGYFSRENTKPSIYDCVRLSNLMGINFNELFTVSIIELI